MKIKKRIFSLLLALAVMLGVFGGDVLQVSAASNMTVDCNAVLGAATHCANGSLYGFIENVPADVKSLVAPLHPYVFRNPARGGNGNQHPYGDAIAVAKKLSNIPGAVVSIDLADMLPYWPYKWPGMDGWLNQVRSFAKDKMASGCTNWYGYEIWNEPDGTFKNNGVSFEEMWKQTYRLLKSIDPNEKIIGPCDSWYNHSRMKSFLQYCKTNNCLPDIMSWHELSGVAGISGHIRQYRALEKELGIPELPISINEYCDPKHEYEGQPGSSARFIGKFERYRIESATISWWFTNAPGRLGSLLATNTQKGAGWYFYKWYGDMTGNMVKVTPPNDDSDLVDGAACVDANSKYISFIFGGPNDGTINTTFINLPSFISSKAKVTVEKIDWVSKDTVSYGPSTVSSKVYDVKNRQISVSVPNTNATSGYRIYITDANGEPAPSNPSDNQPTQQTAVIADGWYYIKNTGSGKYLTVTDNAGKANQNIEIRTGSGVDGQKWKVTNTADGYITITSALGDFMMDVSGAKNANNVNIALYHAYSGDAQKFKAVTLNQNGTVALLTKVSSESRAIDVYENGKTDGSNVIQWDYNGQTNQSFTFEPIKTQQNEPQPQPDPQPQQPVVNQGTIADGWYMIKGVDSGKYLSVDANTGRNTQNIVISGKTEADGQLWKVTNLSNGYFTLTSKLGDFGLDIANASADNGANVQIYASHTGDAQQFTVKNASQNGAYIIATKATDGVKVLDVEGRKKTDGTNVCQYTNNGQTNQMWIFEAVTVSNQPQQGNPEPVTPQPSNPQPEAGKLSASYVINNWGAGYQVSVKVENTSGSDVDTWTLVIPKSEVRIDASWNVTVTESGSDYVITPVSWNSHISNGSSVEFGFQGSGSIGTTISVTVK